jgi:hypothetical protein
MVRPVFRRPCRQAAADTRGCGSVAARTGNIIGTPPDSNPIIDVIRATWCEA